MRSRFHSSVLSNALPVTTILLLGAWATPHANGQIIADSVAGFSGTQGANGWEYGFYAGVFAPSAFAHFPLYTSGTWGPFGPGVWSRSCYCSGGYYTSMWSGGAHPEGTTTTDGRTSETNWSVRRWAATVGGPVYISGHIAKDPIGCGGNGVRGHIFVDGAEVWSQTLASCDTAGVGFGFPACLSAGSIVDFALDPYQSNDQYDTTDFTAQITGPIVQQTTVASACTTGSAAFSVTAQGNGPFTYQWQIEADPDNWIALTTNPLPLSCGGTATVTTPTASSMNIHISNCTGTFHLRCAVTNACGTALSTPATLSICDLPGDLNCNGTVDLSDLAILLAFYGQIGVPPADGDLNGDGKVDLADLANILSKFATRCQ